MWRTFFEQCKESLFPVLCVGCDAPAEREVFCARCRASLEPAPLEAKARAAYAYRGALADALRKAKFDPDETRARAMVPLFIDAFADELTRFIQADVIVYVPSHWRRHIHRGFELPALLARGLAKHTNVPLRPYLRAQRYETPAAARDVRAASRRVRVQGRFTTTRTVPLGSSIVLVDDVVSTGATLQECSHALLQAGAAHVICLALAASP